MGLKRPRWVKELEAPWWREMPMSPTCRLRRGSKNCASTKWEKLGTSIERRGLTRWGPSSWSKTKRRLKTQLKIRIKMALIKRQAPKLLAKVTKLIRKKMKPKSTRVRKTRGPLKNQGWMVSRSLTWRRSSKTNKMAQTRTDMTATSTN